MIAKHFDVRLIALLMSAFPLHDSATAVPLAPGDVIGVDFGVTTIGAAVGTTPSYNNITNTSTSGDATLGALKTTSGNFPDGLGLVLDSTTTNGRAFGHANAPDNWPGTESPAMPESATTDHFFLFSFGGGPTFINLFINGLDTNFTYSLNVVTTSVSNGPSTDTVTVNGSLVSGLTRDQSNAGAFHSFQNLDPSPSGTITIRVDHSAFNPNPGINCFTLEVEGGSGGSTVNDWYAANNLAGMDAAFDADPNNDGIPNGVAYGLGIDPVNGLSATQTGSGNPLPRATISGTTAGGSLTMILSENPPTDVIFIIEESCDLGATPWNEIARKVGDGAWTGAATIAESPPSDSMVTVTVDGTADSSSDPTCFMRLKMLEAAP